MYITTSNAKKLSETWNRKKVLPLYLLCRNNDNGSD